MRKIYIVILILIQISTLSAYIDSITNFSNGKAVFEHGYYTRGVYKYGDRLIVQSQDQLEEFDILPEGQLSRISLFNVGPNNQGFIDNDRFYNFGHTWQESRFIHVTVFDLTVKPMQLITKFNTEIFYQNSTVIFSEKHIMITDYENRRTALYTKDTFKIDGYTKDFLVGKIYKSGDIVAEAFSVYGDIFVRFYRLSEEGEYNISILSELSLNGKLGSVTNIDFHVDKIFISGHNGVLVADISDITNPEITHLLPTAVYTWYSLYEDNTVYTIDFYGNVYAFALGEPNEYTVVYAETTETVYVSAHPMKLDYPYLYVNKEYYLVVYDVSNNFKIVNHHGNTAHSSGIGVAENDFYYITQDYYEDTEQTIIDIYSVLNDGALICSIIYDEWSWNTRVFFKDDYLYIARFKHYAYATYFDVYAVNDKKTTLISSVEVSNNPCSGFIMTDTHVYFKLYVTNGPYSVLVWEINNNILTPKGSFNGTVDISSSKNYIINYYNQNVLFRDINDYQNVVFNKPATYNRDYDVYCYNDEYLLLSDYEANTQLYKYDLSAGSMSLFYNFPFLRVNISNGIITKNAFDYDLNEYYNIVNGKIVKIGEKEDIGSIISSYFFFAQKKMVQYTQSGIWIYDIDYKVPESDVVAVANMTGLRGNYPNPFNPMTTINFGVINSESGINQSPQTHVSINIYNIKGQKVRSLVNSTYPPGEHSVIWNGLDDNGVNVGSGIYFYRMQTENYNETKKMILMK